MKIKTLQIKNFRNIKNLFYEPDKKLNIFLGENGQGKTNILEAIFVLAQGGSFRPVNDFGMVNYEARTYEIRAKYESQDRSKECSLIYCGEGNKILKINGKKARYNNPDRLRVVLFTPDDLFLIKGAPSLRRHFFDFALSQLSLEYSHQLADFSKLIKRRNQILRKRKEKGSSLVIIDDLFCESSAHIIMARLNYANVINEKARHIHKAINSNNGELNIRYALSFNMDSGKINLDRIKTGLKEELESKRKQEYERGSTVIGPHRDDMHVYLNGRLARQFASQGQQRNLAVSLKLAEIEAFYEVKGYYPLFLLDEVMAELDEERRILLLNYLSISQFQSFLTSVNLNIEEREEKYRINAVLNGTLQGRE